MDLIDFSHHAYLIEGNRSVVDVVLKFFKNKKIETQGNPDFILREFSVLGIGEARNIREMQTRANVSENRQFFVLYFDSTTREAQNALLKVLEEPSKQTFFILITKKPNILLPTLKSRAQIIKIEANKENNIDISTFISSTPAERFSMCEDMIKEKDKAETLDFINSLESQSREVFDIKENKFFFEELLKCQGYLTSRSPSVKMILEYICLITPNKLD
jgi:DNA polymerase III delta prime subunit